MAKKDKGRMTADPVPYQIPDPAGGVRMETFIPWTLVKRGVRREVITPLDAPEVFREEATGEECERDESTLVKALGLAHYWQRLLDEGKFWSITEIAAAEGMDVGRVSRIVRLALLAPEIVEYCMAAAEDALRVESLFRQSVLADWGLQIHEINGRQPAIRRR